jgi:hypothetical protein
VDATVDTGGTLDTVVSGGAGLITNRFRQNGLTLADGARAQILPSSWSNANTSVVTSLSIGAGATLDINVNALMVNYSGDNTETAIRDKILEGRGGVGIGRGRWTGTGIISGIAAANNAQSPEVWSIGYANNGSLPLGAYTTYRGQPLDSTAVVIAFTVTGDANLDGKVDDNDVTIVSSNYNLQAASPNWSRGDFDFNGFVSDDDITLLGAIYNTQQAFPQPSPAPAPLMAADAARDTIFAEIAMPKATRRRSLLGNADHFQPIFH